jgi:hypothetical protein
MKKERVRRKSSGKIQRYKEWLRQHPEMLALTVSQLAIHPSTDTARSKAVDEILDEQYIKLGVRHG